MSLTWRCATCGEVLKSWAASERHADAHHGARLEILGLGLLLPDTSPGDVGHREERT